MSGDPHIFGGSASRDLTKSICDYLSLPVGKIQTSSYSDGETRVKVDENVRGMSCFVVQSTYTPVNDHLMELLLIVDALRRASASGITAVMPYFGYARQDRKEEGRVALTAKLVANLITVSGADRVLTMDLHSGQVQGFFDIPVDNMFALPVLINHIRGLDIPNCVVCSPDVGHVRRARAYAKRLDAPLVIVDKRRPKPDESEVMHLIGDVEGRNIFIFDDIIDTAGTICNGVAALKSHGAQDVYVACSHPVFSGGARSRLARTGLKQVYATDSIPQQNGEGLDCLEIVSVAPLLGEAIKRIHSNQSVSELFQSAHFQ